MVFVCLILLNVLTQLITNYFFKKSANMALMALNYYGLHINSMNELNLLP